VPVGNAVGDQDSYSGMA